jgi:hypothetical protein
VYDDLQVMQPVLRARKRERAGEPARLPLSRTSIWPKWHHEAYRPIGVHPYGTGLDTGGHDVRALEGLRRNPGAESVCDVVGDLHRLT